MSATLSVLAPAKLNLFLHITGRRDDGYHTLQTLFQLLDWGDTLHFTPNDSGQITLQSADLGFAQQDNLIVRAAQALALCGKAIALADGRAAVAREDMRRIAHAALRHRIVLNFEAEAEGIRGEAIVDEALKQVGEG